MTSSTMPPAVKANGSKLNVLISEEAESLKMSVVHLWQREGYDGGDGGQSRFDWFYLRKNAPAPRLHLLYASNESAPIGFVGIGPREWWANGRQVRAGVLVDFVVARQHRTLFPAISLQKHAHKAWFERGSLLYAMPNAKATAIFRRMNPPVQLELAEFVRLLRPYAPLTRYMPRVFAKSVGWAVEQLNRLLLHVQLRTCTLSADYEESFGPEFTRFWAELDKTSLSIGCRDATYLTWRFHEHPNRAYRILVVRDGASDSLCGYFVCEMRGLTLAVRDCLLDGDVERQKLALLLLSRAAIRLGAHSVRLVCSELPVMAKALRSALFIRRGARPIFCMMSGERAKEWRDLHWYLTPADEDV